MWSCKAWKAKTEGNMMRDVMLMEAMDYECLRVTFTTSNCGCRTNTAVSASRLQHGQQMYCVRSRSVRDPEDMRVSRTIWFLMTRFEYNEGG